MNDECFLSVSSELGAFSHSCRRRHGQNPLHVAAAKGCKSCIDVLLANEANVDEPECDPWKCVFTACVVGWFFCSFVLL